MEQLVTIEILGQAYTFKSESETARTQEVIDFLVREVTKVEEQLKDPSVQISKLAILLLAALNIVNEHFECKRKYTLLLENVSHRSDHLLRILDQNVSSGDGMLFRAEPGS